MRPFTPEGDTIFLKVVHYTKVFKERVHNKAERVCVCEVCRNMRSMENYLSTLSKINRNY